MTNDHLAYSNPKYRFVRVDEKDSLNDTQQHIFYIGENRGWVASLAESLHNGYSSAINLPQATSFLNVLQQDNYKLTFVLIDVPYHQLHLRQFVNFMAHSAYANLPMVYVSTSLTDRELKEIKEGRLVDDVIHPIRDTFTIGERISFLSKVKKALGKKKINVTGEKPTAELKNIVDVYKRVFDLVFASIVVILAAPLFLLIAILVKIDSKGPVFYNSYRAGRGYRIFKFYKFRTMKVGADRMVSSLTHMNLYGGNETLFFKACNDPRITSIGAFLRRTSLDELPQLFNVLKGDMSIVGNRPLPLYEASTLTTNEWAERFNAPAGITGLWQVSDQGHEKMTMEERVALDIAYARKYNLLLDMKILFKTPKAVIQGQNQ
jgi:lipopolysaccharide/colanic/teichoic acid biosynthesis glycosyltransferase